MKARPILMKGSLVRASMEGRKTQTRRVVKPQPYLSKNGHWYIWAGRRPKAQEYSGSVSVRPPEPRCIARFMVRQCPYGQPGDLLWVRETWCEKLHPDTSKHYDPPRYWYRADGVDVFLDDGDGGAVVNKDGTLASPWLPSIHMPRRASRLTLKITNVRVERLQDISDEDVGAEGIDAGYCYGHPVDIVERNRFSGLWDSINAKRGYSWDDNPWVWVIEYETILKNVDAVLGERER